MVSYSEYDPLVLPAELLAVLPRFDGRPVEEVLRVIEEEERLRLDRDLLRRLVDFQILVRAPS